MTKAELIEAIKDMPDNAEVEFESLCDFTTGYKQVRGTDYDTPSNTIILF
jgi:hypothetical protein